MTNSSNNSHLSYLDATGSIPYGMTNNYMFRLILFLHLPRNPFTSPMQMRSQEKNAAPVRTMNLWNMSWLKEIHNLQKKMHNFGKRIPYLQNTNADTVIFKFQKNILMPHPDKMGRFMIAVSF